MNMTTDRRSKPKAAAPAGAIAGPAAPGGQHGWVASGMVHLSDPQMKPAMEQLKQRIASDPDFARSLLRSAGIVTAKGKLAKRFGG